MFRKFLLIFILQFCLNCQSYQFYHSLKSGDLVFVEAEKEKLSGAISRVTKNNEDNISFDHVGIVEVNANKKYILHSAPENGSEKVTLKSFIKNSHQKNKVLVSYRLNDEYKNCIDEAVKKANTMLGKPYNKNYILNESEYYCSDFVERAYRSCNIFTLEPMTFINPETGKTDAFWQNFYQSKNIEVPEGKLGCNPNGISKSKKIHPIGILK
ncbi:MAG: hypothetical protein KBA33_08830 [Cloacibacterium sp.]|nr:hypothetical protein [Cloacibacterium sp.]